VRFGDRLRAAREKAGLDQAELARLVGLDQSTLNHYERHRRRPDFQRLTDICKHLDVTTDSLIIGE